MGTGANLQPLIGRVQQLAQRVRSAGVGWGGSGMGDGTESVQRGYIMVKDKEEVALPLQGKSGLSPRHVLRLRPGGMVKEKAVKSSEKQ